MKKPVLIVAFLLAAMFLFASCGNDEDRNNVDDGSGSSDNESNDGDGEISEEDGDSEDGGNSEGDGDSNSDDKTPQFKKLTCLTSAVKYGKIFLESL